MQYTLKKSLGQHFLHDETICLRIVESMSDDVKNVLEIGPGGGAITKYLMHKPYENYVCIELDKDKIDYLHKQYPSLQGKILHDDFLDAELPFDTNFSIIGNFPYNISTQIIFKVLEWRNQVDEVVGMFQKEVAQRIASKHGSKEYGILSVLAQAYYTIEYLFDVEAACFTPPPKVVSGVIKLVRKAGEEPVADYNKFKTFVKAAFNMRRKTLRNGFKSLLPAEKLQDEIFNKRAEQLSVEQFISLYTSLYES
ncbi:MAG: ribosomal RNA small subunit methyltransferase A [Bacteroidetes bacterium]|nr:ribosomal RNA small subunit methyltransferase A [Bacteroidota bacterium]